MAIFGDIPLRSNGEVIEASWFNTIRSKLISAFGDVEGAVAQAISNSVTNQDVTTLSFDSAEVSEADVEYILRRKTDSGEVFLKGGFSLQYMQATDAWRIKEGEFRGDDVGVTFTLLDDTGGGSNVTQVRYTSDNFAGTSYVGNIVTSYKTWGVI